ncbi:LysM peptidoglycan-binding domain-containing protein, partial [Pyxidicoccus sp. 3LFB2]
MSSRAGGALRVLLVAVLFAGCVGPRAAAPGPDLGLDTAEEPQASAVVPVAAPSPGKRSALPFALRGAHPEPELVTVRHRVAAGETMYRIAKTYGLSVEELGSANGIKAPWTLVVGQELTVPGVERRASEEAPEAL